MGMTGLTDGQMYGFLVLNVLLENMTNHLHVPFQTQYLVAVFFLACEELSCRAWDVNFVCSRVIAVIFKGKLSS